MTPYFLRICLLTCALVPMFLLAQSPSYPQGIRQNYVCYRSTHPIKADGKLKEADWQAAPWSESFMDIEGTAQPEPRYQTRMKMLWDDNYLYIAAELEEPNLWATLTQRESVVFMDNNFEIFLDPNWDTHLYYEWEVNALGTEWDLLMAKPYRDGGPALSAWNINGLLKGIDLRGSLNDPSDTDEGWTLEVALPWKVLMEGLKGDHPLPAEQWRVNFSRVEWQLEVKNGVYHKKINPETGRPFPENNWIWSPPGPISMHQPELWGYLQFSGQVAGSEPEAFHPDPDEHARWALWELYYQQFAFFEAQHRYATSLKELAWEGVEIEGVNYTPEMSGDEFRYRAQLPGTSRGHILQIQEDGKYTVITP